MAGTPSCRRAGILALPPASLPALVPACRHGGIQARTQRDGRD